MTSDHESALTRTGDNATPGNPGSSAPPAMNGASGNNGGSDEFPILCETCLGPNPYVRMLKDELGHACKVCERPFTSFRWRPAGDGMRAKKTEVCQTCARAKNVCQTCLLDLQYGLPVQVRDALLLTSAAENNTKGSSSLVKKLNCNGKMIPQSDGVKEYTVVQAQRLIDSGVVDKLYNNNNDNNDNNNIDDTAKNQSTKGKSKALTVNQRLIEKLKKRSQASSGSSSGSGSSTPSGLAKYNRNRVRVCSFFFKGKCKRGLYCPYRHELSDTQQQANATDKKHSHALKGNEPVSGRDHAGNGVSGSGENNMSEYDLDKQNLRDRYYGVNDPVAKKIFDRTGMTLTPDGKLSAIPKRPNSSTGAAPPVPKDTSIKSVFIGGLNSRVTEAQVRSIFTPGAVPASAIRQVTMRVDRGFAFVEFVTRQRAEVAMEKCHGPHAVNETTKLTVNWGKSKKVRSPPDGDAGRNNPNPTTNFAPSTTNAGRQPANGTRIHQSNSSHTPDRT